MQALFDRNAEHVGWISKGTYIFDQNMQWVAFISRGHAWSALTGDWLGPVHGTTCLDKKGCVVAWHSPQEVHGMERPLKPKFAPGKPAPPGIVRKVNKPSVPAPPVDPPGGWSEFGWVGWTTQGA